MTADEKSPFDPDLITEAAETAGVDRDALVDAIEAHQRSVADLPGIENLVYEWRKRHEEPLVEQTDRVYCCVVPATVWEEFGSHLGLADAVREALRTVHKRQVARRTDGAEPPAGETSVLLARGDDWPGADV